MFSNIAFAIWKTRLSTLHYVQCLNLAPMEKAWFMAPMDKKLRPQWNIPSYFIASMEKASFYEITVMVNDKKRCLIKDPMSIKISFMHYRNYITWTRVKWTVAFEEFDMVYLFWLLFSFQHHCQSLSICKRSTLAKIWFLRTWVIKKMKEILQTKKEMILLMSLYFYDNN